MCEIDDVGNITSDVRGSSITTIDFNYTESTIIDQISYDVSFAETEDTEYPIWHVIFWVSPHFQGKVFH